MLVRVLLFSLILSLAPAPGAAAAGPSPSEVLARLFTDRPVQAEWFAPAFLAQVPAAQVEAIIANLLETFGPFEAVQLDGARFLVLLEEAEIPSHVALDDQGAIVGLFFETPRPRSGATLEEAVAPFRELPGRVSLLVVENGLPIAAIDPDEPLAVGSAFKLAVLAALQEQVAQGLRRWDEVIVLDPAWKSLPTGILQAWPDGASLTVHTLAALMISQSDNTAADALIHLVGREAVERSSPRNTPFLTTREAFILKGNEALLAAYRQADESGRRALLERLASEPLPSPDIFASGPRALDVEWFMTASELCALMSRVQDLPLMRINPGAADPQAWAQVAFKGGSEPGVINLTTGLVRPDGSRLCISATWNTETPPAGMEAQFVNLYSRLLATLAR